jgi:hypothetical protein
VYVNDSGEVTKGAVGGIKNVVSSQAAVASVAIDHKDYKQIQSAVAQILPQYPKVKIDRVRIGKSSGFMDAGRILDKTKTLTLSSEFFGAKAKYDASASVRPMAKATGSISRNLKEATIHELGHIVQASQSKAQIDRFSNKAIDKYVLGPEKHAKALQRSLGRYATSNIGEAVAEAFVLRHTGRSNAVSRDILKMAGIK